MVEIILDATRTSIQFRINENCVQIFKCPKLQLFIYYYLYQ